MRKSRPVATSAAFRLGVVDGEHGFQNAEEVGQWLITQKLISTVPWDDACANLRFSVTFAAKDPMDEQRVLKEIAARLGDVTFEF